jgi:hypothetical protein
MRTSIARFISIAGHPFVLVPLLIFLPRYQSDRNGAIRVVLLFAAIVFFPMSILIWRSVASGRWSTVDASDKDNRPLLYKVSIAVSFAAAAYFHFVEPSPSIVRGSIVVAGMLFLAAVLNRRIKISLHLAFACFCGILLIRVRLSYGLPMLLLVPALIWSRIVLSRHVFSEALGGILMGTLAAACFIWE